MEFEDGEFDLLCCRHVLEHSVAPLFTLTEIPQAPEAGRSRLHRGTGAGHERSSRNESESLQRAAALDVD
jgi:hypothetical protein